jgi:hypothetical protein
MILRAFDRVAEGLRKPSSMASDRQFVWTSTAPVMTGAV